jgi:ElaB/YqjD/DUF883 family membrane-anchored ribosome-binding protein
MDPATPVDAIHLDPDTQPAAPLPPPPEHEHEHEPAASAIDQMRAVEHRLAIARNRMIRRLVEVSRRVDTAREKLDPAHIIGDHPFTAVGIAFGAGALLGLPGKRGSGKPTVPNRAGGLVAGLAFALVKDALGTWVKKSIATAMKSHDSSASLASPAARAARPVHDVPPAPETSPYVAISMMHPTSTEAAPEAAPTGSTGATTTLPDLPPIRH